MTWEEMLQMANGPVSGSSATGHKSKRHIEDKLQVACVCWFSAQYPTLAPLLHHSPNGGARSKAEGAMFKAMGTRAGFPDLFLYVPQPCASGSLPTGEGGGRGWHGLAIEMKTTEKSSRQSAHQKEWQQRLTNQGYQYTVCRTLEEFINTINNYLKPTRQC